MTSSSGPPSRKRVRAPEAHRGAILDAARAAFAERGYARATIREIAARAGVTHGLVMRHFGSKEQLFLAAVPGTRDLPELVPGPPGTLPERIARAFVERMERADSGDPFLALIRSAASDESAATALYTAMRQSSTEAYRTVLTGPDADERIDLLGAHLIGVAFSRYVLRSGPVAEMTPERLVRYLARSLRCALEPLGETGAEAEAGAGTEAEAEAEEGNSLS
ncbi:TetR/AcrR family transcriptional regulator [Streptomyces fuscichromogenes]|uniref:TetR family transcriptional regulator n=1 Tax=Streptomyces fuscichromogenes TaxID=1324013 RepID=A0A918CPV9_9ACTN|nr:TetR family transcriptional regulator [Streptomyces fuscichromogenes]GGN00261.1 TetR family transcriptional regulator [Streptomyces fuscichromogenes]